jgi:hypothetical protein
MKRILHMGVTAAAGAVALAFSSSASAAAISPTLRVSAGGPTLTLNTADQASVSGDPVAKIQFYVPAGFGLKMPAAGAVIGTATSRALVKDIDPGLEQTLSGDVTSISPTDPSIAYENANCDPSTHMGALLVRFTGQQPQISQTINVPIFIDATSGTETQFGAIKLVVCMRAPDVSVGAQNRAAFGTKFDTFRVQLEGFKLPAKVGDYRWRSLWTPFTPGTATMNNAGSAEAQSVVHAPAGVLTLTAKASNGRVALSGLLLIGGKPANAVAVGIASGTLETKLASIGSVKTNGVGKYLKLTIIHKSRWFQAGATVFGKDLGRGFCQASFGVGVPCTDATAGDSYIVSRYIQVKR